MRVSSMLSHCVSLIKLANRVRDCFPEPPTPCAHEDTHTGTKSAMLDPDQEKAQTHPFNAQTQHAYIHSFRHRPSSQPSLTFKTAFCLHFSISMAFPHGWLRITTMHKHPPSKSHRLAMQRCQAKCHAQTHDQHGVAAWLAQDASDAGDVLHGVHEEYYGSALKG